MILAREDRPVDILNVLRSMVSDNLRLPRRASAPLIEASAGGRSILTSWMAGHLEQMRKNRGKSVEQNLLAEVRRTGLEVGGPEAGGPYEALMPLWSTEAIL